MVILMTVISEDKNRGNSSIVDFENLKPNNRIGFATILFGVYSGMIPLNMVMNFTGSGTLNRYVGIFVIIAILIDLLLKKQAFILGKEFIPIFLFTIFAFASCFWSVNIQSTFSALLSLLSMITFYFVCINKVYTDSEKAFIKICCIVGGVLISLYLISTRHLYYTRVFITTSGGQAIDPNDLSSSLAFGGLFIFDYLLRNKVNFKGPVIVVCMFIILYGMLLTGSRGGMLGLVMGFTMLMILDVRNKAISKARVLLFCVIVFILLFILYRTEILSAYINSETLGRLTLNSALETGGTGRATIWMNTIKTAFESPIIGYGFAGGPYELYQKYGTFIGTHNVVFSLLLGTGLIGLAIMVPFIFLNIKCSVLKKDALTLSMMVMLIAFCGTLDYLLNKNFWNVMIYSQIGLGVIQTPVQTMNNVIYSESVGISE